MTGSIALDVVIGLVFIYLLYSLFATVIMEIINTLLGLRARNLRYALRRMLMDEMDIKGGEAGAKILNTFKKVSGTASNLTNNSLFDGFYERPSIKYLGAGGAASKPSYITSKNFSKSLIDVLKDFFVLQEFDVNTADSISQLEKIQSGISQLPNNSDTKKHLESLLVDAQNDLEKFKLLLEQWFDETMQRATGWFKRRTQYYLFIIGFILAFSFNANTLTMMNKLANDKEARAQLVEMASNYTKDNQELIDDINNLKSEDSDEGDNKSIEEATELVKTNIQSMQSITGQLQEDINEANNVISNKWETPQGEPLTSFWDKFCHVFSLRYIWGYLLTALAVSLGSPFWFDLLNKLITLRNSLQPKKEATEATSNKPDATPKRVG